MLLYKKKFFLAFACLLAILSGTALAEYIDASDAQADYAGLVAQAVSLCDAGHAQTYAEPSSAEDSTIVLYRTTGSAPDLTRFSPAAVIRGPQNCFTAVLPSEDRAEECIAWLLAQDDTLYAEKDGVAHACSEATACNSWGGNEMGFVEIRPFAEKTASGSQTVAVIDSGTWRHPFLNSRISSLGFDYVDVDRDPTNDGYGHGTHVAGIIVDCTRDFNVLIMPIRVLNNGGSGSIANITNAIREATTAKVDVINLSLTTLIHSDAMDSAIADAISAGVTVVIAAGNDSRNTDSICPSHLTLSGAIVVGSCELSGDTILRSSYSNYGTSVDVSAFGSDISSCWINGGYMAQSGTSMAAPHISAAAAMLRLMHGGMSPSAVEGALKRIAVPANAALPGVPAMELLVPTRAGFHADSLVLPAGSYRITSDIHPSTALSEVCWSSSNPEAVYISEDGLLVCAGSGSAVLTADCEGYITHETTIEVLSDPEQLVLPAGLKKIESDAFRGSAAKYCVLPEGIEEIADGAFACENLRVIRVPASLENIGAGAFDGTGGLSILCPEGSAAVEYASAAELDAFIPAGSMID